MANTKIPSELVDVSGIDIEDVQDVDTGTSDPTISTNPSAAGAIYINKSSGEVFGVSKSRIGCDQEST